MVAQVPLFQEPLPDPYSLSSDEFESSVVEFNANLNPYGSALNQLAEEVEVLSMNAQAAAGELANGVWSADTAYEAGDVRYSPLDFMVYRRKTNGAGSTDPSLDPTNWALQTKTNNGGSDTTSGAVDITLTALSGRLQVISMTAADKIVTLPSSTTVQLGAPVFVFKNSGIYRFSVHKNGGEFVCYVQPGQVIALHCSDITTAAGVWQFSGENVSGIYTGNGSEVLNAVDSRLISVAMLSATKAICAYRNNSTTFLNAVILNFGSASGSPLAINAEASEVISIAAQASNQATVIYQLTTGVLKGYVLDISGNTITPGSVATIDASAAGSNRQTALTVLSSSKLLCVYQNNSSTVLKERVLDIAASAITASSSVAPDATGSVSTNFHDVAGISATKALVAFIASTNVNLRLQSISGSTPAPTGSLLTLSTFGTNPGITFGLALLGSSKAIVAQSVDRTYSDIMITLLDISGTSPVVITEKLARVNLKADAHIRAAALDDNNCYLTWASTSSVGVDAMVVSVTEDNVIILKPTIERITGGVSASYGYLACDALDSKHVMQVCRNSSTFLSAKTVEISA